MPEILPRHYVIGIIIFTMVIVGGVSIISDFSKGNANFVNQDKFKSFNRTFNKMEELDQEVGDLKETVTEAQTDPGLFGFLDALIGSSWTALQSIFASFSFMNAVFGGLYTVLGIPSWVGNLVISLITILFVFAIFTVIFQREI